ncbi:MAG: lipid-A-disaccharide synthase [Alphaproteobacteria bacterium]|nr:lipid-A-disaccharide synthase [Alphaproteobacteria bacterium]
MVETIEGGLGATEAKTIRIFLIAGEPSGDLLGGRLMGALKRHSGGDVVFAGVGGERMNDEGLISPFPMTELSVMGLAEILPRIFNLRRRVRETAKAIEQYAPDILVTIDSPGFCFAVLKRLKRVPETRRIHYVAPSVWAWRPGRVHKFAREFDHILTLLPFEPAYFEPVGLKSTFVGHAVIESKLADANGVGFRKQHRIGEEVPLLCVLPGSRQGEVKRHMAPFRLAVQLLQKRFPLVRVVIPTIPGLKDEVTSTIQNWGSPVLVVEGEKDKFDAMAASNVALAASGTVTLELALARVPSVVAYRMNLITGWIIKALVKIPYANLVNILLDREGVPEFIQGKCTGDRLADALENLLRDKLVYEAQQTAADEAIKLLKTGDGLPSDIAANTILSLVRQG